MNLREQREKLIADARAIQDRADADKRSLTADELVNVKNFLAAAKDLTDQITAREELEAAERMTGAPESQRVTRKSDAPATEQRDAYNKALRSYLQNGFAMMDANEQKVLRSGYVPFDGENRAQSTLSGSVGGFDVAPDTSFYGKIIEAQKFYGGMFQAGCTVLNTTTGADLPIPTTDDTSNVGAIVAEEGSHASGSNVTLAQTTLHAYLYSSKIVKVSWQLLQDAETDWEGFLARIFGQRLGRIQNTHLTTGTGTGQPQGVVTGASSGRQSATGNTSSVPYDDIIRLEHSVDVAYRANAKFMTSDSTALALRLLKDGNGQYIWKTGDGGQPDRLNGKPVIINNDLATMTTSAKHTLFGDFSNYFIRQVRGIQVVRLNELYAENGQVGFMAFMRFDGGLVNAGQGPIKYLQNSGS